MIYSISIFMSIFVSILKHFLRKMRINNINKSKPWSAKTLKYQTWFFIIYWILIIYKYFFFRVTVIFYAFLKNYNKFYFVCNIHCVHVLHFKVVDVHISEIENWITQKVLNCYRPIIIIIIIIMIIIIIIIIIMMMMMIIIIMIIIIIIIILSVSLISWNIISLFIQI